MTSSPLPTLQEPSRERQRRTTLTATSSRGSSRTTPQATWTTDGKANTNASSNTKSASSRSSRWEPGSTALCWVVFLEIDPVEGGSANDYDYSNADSVNGEDLDGLAPKPPELNAREKQALADERAGRKADSRDLKSAKAKLRQGQKYRGERNKQKHASNFLRWLGRLSLRPGMPSYLWLPIYLPNYGASRACTSTWKRTPLASRVESTVHRMTPGLLTWHGYPAHLHHR